MKQKKRSKRHLPPAPRVFIKLKEDLNNPSIKLYEEAITTKTLPFALRARIINTYERNVRRAA